MATSKNKSVNRMSPREKMIKAMTVNMYRPMPGMPGIEPDADDQNA